MWSSRVQTCVRSWCDTLVTWLLFVLGKFIESQFLRLETLNKYAGMKLDSHPRKKTASEEEDEEDFCALSERWEYQKSVRRWSRKDLQTPSSPGSLSAGASKGGDSKGFNIASEDAVDGRKTSHTTQRAPSHDSLLADQEDTGQSETGEKSGYLDVAETQGRVEDVHDHTLQNDDEDNQNDRHTSSSSSASSTLSPRLRRAASERIKTAKSLWRKMEGGLKSRKSRRHNGGATGGALEISDPVLADKGGDMKARLERLQCVDIKQEDSGQSGVVTADALSSRLAATSSAEQSTSDSLDAVSKATHQTSVVTATTSQSTPGSGGEPLPQPAFRSRPSESEPSVSISQSESQSETEKPPAPDARLTEYYSAQSQFQHNLRQAQQKTSASDGLGNLMEIFLVPQDHQPGRFPTALQNGYIEKDPHLSAASTRVRDLGESKRLDEIRNQEGVQSQHPALRGARGMGANRTSVYDNFGPPSTQPSGSRLLNSRFSPIDEDDKKSASVPRGSRALSADNAADASSETLIGVKNRSVSFDSASEWAVRSVEAATTDDRVRSRSISFESNPELEKKAGQAVTDSDSLSCRTDACSEPLPSKGVSHSVSADSYFQDPAPSTSMSDAGSVSSNTSQDDGSSCSSSTVHYSNYEEFEAILKQLYENISDLTSVIDWDDDDPTLSSMDTKPTPSQSATTALHVDTPSHALTSRGNDLRLRPEPGHDPNIDLDLDLDSPLSPTSDPLALSPAASRGEGATDESLDLDQHENSSSSSAGDGGSHTADSGSDDAEALIADLSHDDSLDTIPAVTRERRDSGVGHSLTRAPSDRRRKKIRWHSFQRSHRPDVTCRAQQVNALTVGQLVRLQKLALLKLTGIMEKCLPVNKSGWNWMMPRFMKRHKAPDFSDRTVFGVPLSVMVQRTGQPLPQCVLYAMRYLRRTSQNSIGIFRKSGVRSKILQLRDHLEAHPDTTDFEGMNAYNVADMLKTFFRDLPECLLTNKMSETFRSIYTHVPSSQRLEAIQAAILLLPDENREVLQSILLFLSDISSHQAEHQMNASNLAVCFTPTVFQLGRSGSGSPASPKRGRKLGGSNSHSPGTPDPREIMEQKAAHECLHMLIMECKHLFTVPPHLFRQLQVISLAHEEPGPLHDLGTSTEEVRAFGQERIQFVLKEAHDRKGHWTSMPSVGDVDVYSRKPIDDYPLKEWKLVVEIEAPPIEVLRRIMHERHAWDEDLLSWSVVERLDPHSDIFQYALNTMAPHPSRHYCVLRYWRSDLTKGSCALVTMSVEHSDAASIQGVWAIDLGSYFLMEPCGAGRSRLIYLTRVDTRGRTPEWYTKMYGHIQANFLERLKDSFKQETSGPETKV
ncbi:rho GTPase-activating protein 7 [Plakobranchus ocellatus]|uniref:Rho GTPase-activating protein 7 n=1 Tax=Plakobranchus ocellatus TaxID=259542 RepID=A0AAV3XWQ3_9GAST|nr:rho GTPase-activating protein 7 [Plakobranchus ocellatus]